MVQSQRRLFPPMRMVSAHSAHIFLSISFLLYVKKMLSLEYLRAVLVCLLLKMMLTLNRGFLFSQWILFHRGKGQDEGLSCGDRTLYNSATHRLFKIHLFFHSPFHLSICTYVSSSLTYLLTLYISIPYFLFPFPI